MIQRIRGQLFLVGLILSVSIGFAAHSTLAPVAAIAWLRTAIVLLVMSMMAAPVPLELFAKTIGRPWPGLLASLICLGVTPLLGWVGSWFLEDGLGQGLMVVCCVPSTLASAAVITRKAGGDDTVPVFVTILTNLSCVLVTPLWLVALLGSATSFGIWGLAEELALLVVLPIVCVQFVRWRSVRFREWANRAKWGLSVACQVGILVMVLLGSVQMGQRWYDPLVSSKATTLGLLAVIASGLVIHLSALWLGWWTARLTSVRRAQAIGVAFSGSQKTLMIGINLAIDYGVSILPMIAFHVSQLLVDAIIAQFWNRVEQEPEKHNAATHDSAPN